MRPPSDLLLRAAGQGMLPLSYGLEIVHFLEPRWADHEFR